MKVRNRIIIAIIIVVVVSLISICFNQQWLLVLYNLVLACFIQEIKTFFQKFEHLNQVRVSYAYLFKIEYSGNYLLVKDEQGRNNYHPVGGVYKYYPDKIDIGDNFNGEYDGLFNLSRDTVDDLRLKINKRKLKDFQAWFKKEENREASKDLSREFREELIDRQIVSKHAFKTIKYHYVGSYTKKSFNKKLRMKQIHHFDIYSLELSNSQRTCLNRILSINSEKYLFARQEDILNGYMSFGGKRYEIADYCKLILNSKLNELVKEYDSIESYQATTDIYATATK